MITTGDYAPRCRNIGIECWDGKDFQKQERKWIWVRRVRTATLRTILIAGIGVFAYSVWDKSFQAHDQAEKIRREALNTSKEALKYSQEAYKTVKGWWDELYKKIGS